MKQIGIALFLSILFGLGFMLTDIRAAIQGDVPTILKVESPYGLEETIDNTIQVIQARNFHLIREQTLADGILPTQDSDQYIVYFCNFSHAYETMQKDKQVGFMLPCRVTITEEDGKVYISAINPEAIKSITNTKVAGVCDNSGDNYTGLMEEATL